MSLSYTISIALKTIKDTSPIWHPPINRELWLDFLVVVFIPPRKCLRWHFKIGHGCVLFSSQDRLLSSTSYWPFYPLWRWKRRFSEIFVTLTTLRGVKSQKFTFDFFIAVRISYLERVIWFSKTPMGTSTGYAKFLSSAGFREMSSSVTDTAMGFGTRVENWSKLTVWFYKWFQTYRKNPCTSAWRHK